jgi:phosphocarrier protein HPr
MGQGMAPDLVMSNFPVTRTVVVVNTNGLHARPAERLTRTALGFGSRIEVICRNERIDAKSMLNWMTLAATEGTELVIEADGDDAAQAVEALANLIESGFVEENRIETK